MLAAFRRYLAQLQLPWSKPQRGNFALYATGFLAERSLPIRRVARALAGPKASHRHMDKRLRHFLGNPKLDREGALGAYLRFLLPRFGQQPCIPVMADWTHVGRQHAVFILHIPYRGRSFPLSAVFQRWEGNEDMTDQEEEGLALLRRVWPSTAPPPLILADRGFAKSGFLQWLLQHDWLFIIRARRRTQIRDAQGRQLYPNPGLGEVITHEHVTYHEFGRVPGRLVATAARDKRGKLSQWLLFTNLPALLLPQAIKLYAQRMSPEETHRDCKRGHFVSGFALSHLGRMSRVRLNNLLCCLVLIYGLLVLVAETERETREWLKQRHWGLSLATFGLDLLRAASEPVRATIKRALGCVTLRPLWLETGDS
jgi:hypothetical protein